jgi:hypothetical protein
MGMWKSGIIWVDLGFYGWNLALFGFHFFAKPNKDGQSLALISQKHFLGNRELATEAQRHRGSAKIRSRRRAGQATDQLRVESF